MNGCNYKIYAIYSLPNNRSGFSYLNITNKTRMLNEFNFRCKLTITKLKQLLIMRLPTDRALSASCPPCIRTYGYHSRTDLRQNTWIYLYSLSSHLVLTTHCWHLLMKLLLPLRSSSALIDSIAHGVKCGLRGGHKSLLIILYRKYDAIPSWMHWLYV